jgi:ATP synthase protein I
MNARTAHRTAFHKLPVFPVLLTQLLVLLLAAATLFGWHGAVEGYSGFYGGLIAWLPNLYFAHKAFRFSGARAAKAIMRSFYAGEAGKLILTAVLFALLFAGVKPLSALAVFGVFVLTQSVGWFSPLLIRAKHSRP